MNQQEQQQLVEHCVSTTPFKVIMVGDFNVGKSTVWSRMLDGSMNAYSKTSFFSKEIQRKDGRNVKLQIWDTASQEKYGGLSPTYFRHSSIVMLCFDISNRTTFDNLKNIWISNVETYKSNAKYLLVGCKLDESNQHVSHQQATEFADNLSRSSSNPSQYIEVSGKSNVNIELLESTLAEMIDLENQKTVDQQQPTTGATTKIVNNFYYSLNL